MNEQTKAQVEAYAEECRTEQLELLRTLGKMPAPTRREDFRAAFCRDWLRAHWERCLRRPDGRIFGQHSAGIGSGHKGQKMSASTALKM